MLNVVSLLPHCKKDNKVESKSSKGATLNELVELKGCSSCLFFEVSILALPLCPCLHVNSIHNLKYLKYYVFSL